MTKEDFYKGQTVYLLLVNNEARGRTIEQRIKETKITSVGRKYIEVDYCNGIKFEIENNFREKSDYCPNYVLYLSKEDIYADIKRTQKENNIEKAFRTWEYRLVRKFSDEDLDIVLNIAKKYVPDVFKEK